MRKGELFIHESDLFFEPQYDEVIYIETPFDEKNNLFVKTYYDKIEDYIINEIHSSHFIYLPKQLEILFENQDLDVIRHFHPDKSIKDIIANKNQIEGSIYDYFRNVLLCIGHNGDFIPITDSGFINYVEKRGSYYVFNYQQLTDSLRTKILQFEKCQNCDFYSNYSDVIVLGEKIIEEIRERIDKLNGLGISKMTLQSIFFPQKLEEKLSRLVITKDYRIILPDYNNLEIKMAPLPKAVYFLYLEYPYGIPFKYLFEYTHRLMCIYKTISNRENWDSMLVSIDAITDPTNNSINEKCSRIREAFLREFDESIAENYFITGESATPKKILLDRRLVHWEAPIYSHTDLLSLF